MSAHGQIDNPIAVQLARYVTALKYEDLPADAIADAKTIIMDQLACQLVGSTLPWVRPALQLVELTKGVRAESTIVNHRTKYLAADAAFVNATYGQSCELDDVAFKSAGHIGTATIPVALAVGEAEKINGKQLLLSIIAGYEVMYRIMAAIRPYHHSRGFHSQSVGGPFAGAVAAGKIYGLNAEQMTHALAIAGSHSCGPVEFDQSGGEVKRIHAGLGARGGVHSAQLAKFGLTGPPTIIEGKRGVLNLFATQSNPAKITEDLGRKLNIHNTWFKVYPAVGGVHTSIAATERLVVEHRLKPNDVARIRVGLSEILMAHATSIRQPHDVLSAQFSLAFSIALALVKGSNDLAYYMNPEVWSDPEIVGITKLVDAYAHPDAVAPKDFMAAVEIELKDGRKVSAREDYPIGMPPNPASRERLRQKATSLCRTVLPQDRVNALLGAIEKIEAMDNVAQLTAFLAP